MILSLMTTDLDRAASMKARTSSATAASLRTSMPSENQRRRSATSAFSPGLLGDDADGVTCWRWGFARADSPWYPT
jgi:hypothetical protein